MYDKITRSAQRNHSVENRCQFLKAFAKPHDNSHVTVVASNSVVYGSAGGRVAVNVATVTV